MATIDKAKLAAIKAVLAATKHKTHPTAHSHVGVVKIVAPGVMFTLYDTAPGDTEDVQRLDIKALQNGVIQPVETLPEADFPTFGERCEDTPALNDNAPAVELLNTVDLTTIVEYTSTDNSRSTLCAVQVDEDAGAMWATSGHRGYIVDSLEPLPWGLSIPSEHCAAIQKLKATIGPVESVAQYCFGSSNEGRKVITTLIGSGWLYEFHTDDYSSVLIEDTHTRGIVRTNPLPAISKIVPERGAHSWHDKALSSHECATVAAATKALKPFANDKTRLVMVDRDGVRANYNGNRYFAEGPNVIPDAIDAEKRIALAFNAEYAAQLFTDVALLGDAVFSVPEKPLSVHLLRSGRVTAILMPLRTIEAEGEEYHTWKDSCTQITYTAPKAKGAPAAPKRKAQSAPGYSVECITYALAALGLQVQDHEAFEAALEAAKTVL